MSEGSPNPLANVPPWVYLLVILGGGGTLGGLQLGGSAPAPVVENETCEDAEDRVRSMQARIIEMNRWQDDEHFCSWLLAMRYAEVRNEKMFPFMALGMILYMHEAYREGLKAKEDLDGPVLIR